MCYWYIFLKEFEGKYKKNNFMNVNQLRNRLTNIIDSKNLNYTEVERGAGLPRAALRNFINGTVKEPKLEIILGVAKFLELDINELLSPNYEEDRSVTKKSDSISKVEINKPLLLDCVRALIDYLDKRRVSLTLEESLLIVKKVYVYSLKYGEGKLDASFLEWCLETGTD